MLNSEGKCSPIPMRKSTAPSAGLLGVLRLAILRTSPSTAKPNTFCHGRSIIVHGDRYSYTAYPEGPCLKPQARIEPDCHGKPAA